ncbi:FAD-dependent oxidoreductase [Cellulomonas sp. KRMCY2]|uniref:FAD-dependent oxidoreductase n=1 Tax=Cellulomonas sp. KRMCY2 TaxID=1304865 RepID=UPI00045EA3C6|nr:FAD-dependent oxidoreductase [Cellulomonas sp. KRMCY2]
MTRVVVVGNGMVGSRFVEELTARAPGVDVTVLGTEEYEPYNRVLLSEVVAGALDVASLTLPRPPAGPSPAVGARGAGSPSSPLVRPGTTALAIDRVRRSVSTDAAGPVGYDLLVLATGARARVPEIPGLEELAGLDPLDRPMRPGALPAGVHALRTLDDAREIVAATVNARRAVVLGGGVLGLEAACGLARRGLHVTVVHAGPHLMDRQLDREAADAVLHGLDRLGIEHRTDTRTEQVLVRDGVLRGLRLAPSAEADGTFGDDDSCRDDDMLPADLLVLATGTVPETGLAATAGLEVRRGIVVDSSGATSDPAVFAIGDCAEPPEGGTGLVAQGWDQARRLAAQLAAGRVEADRVVDGRLPATPVTLHGTDVVRLKAHGLEVVAMGVCGPQGRRSNGRRAVRLSDPFTGRHVEVVVQDGVVVGATCVGAGALGADLAAAYTRQTPAPTDPAHLLLRPVRGASSETGAEPSPTLMPDRATVCRCNGVTKGDIVACWRAGAASVADVTRATRATTGCGGCTDAVCGIVDWLERSDPPAPPTDPPAPPADLAGSTGAGQRVARRPVRSLP